jgi:hypothetical protein
VGKTFHRLQKEVISSVFQASAPDMPGIDARLENNGQQTMVREKEKKRERDFIKLCP